ncbi:hypothetical protein POM88_010570 [Heracleum sosnowskyi]|uniref:Uncharacterized protein n=1 Tax=Heracleum sosnowskyi TaxID=360622 RepID=A0AAD8IUL8_9APIA|nr:hypothetical protein POM88_010570 [Heracleum sosnowskyi]
MDNESFLDLMARTNAVFNLSEADHLISPHESESDETDGEDGDNPNSDSDSASSEGEEGDNPSTAVSTHVPTAPWFSTEAFTYNNVTDNSAHAGAQLKMLCWLAGNTSQVRKFERAMKKIKELNPAAEEWLRNIPLEMWTMSHDGGYRYGQATTNMVETYNGQLRSARHLPITSMVEYIYYRSVKLVAERRTQTLNDLQNGHVYCKNSRELFQKIEQKASAHKIIPYNQERGVFEVTTARYKTDKGFWKGGNKHHIDLSKGYCSCGKWHSARCPQKDL